MDVKVGPHWYRNSNGTVEIEGLPQIELEIRKTGTVPVRVNFVIFDSGGKLHAKVEANSLVINEQSAYNLERSEKGLMLTTENKQKRVLAINVGENNQVEIPEGEFYTLKGHILKITPQEWSVEKTTGKAGETDMKGQPVAVGV
jgi:transcription antitermination factor NusG